MGRLTTAQLSLLRDGQPIRQQWYVKSPTAAAHAYFVEVLLDEGVGSRVDSTVDNRVVKAGKRKHLVWNPHPNITIQPKAVRYAFTCSNSDGYLHVGALSAWDPYGIYNACKPQECFIIHKLSVYDPDASAWSPMTHMDFIGRIVSVTYTASPAPYPANRAPGEATIVTEQVGAWDVLRRVFTINDGDDEMVTNVAIGDFTFTVV